MTTPICKDAPGILVVDDEPSLLLLIKTFLARRGFQVWSCASGEEAVDLFRQNANQICLVLLDVCMPGMDGPQTLKELRKIDTNFHSCFMSGFLGPHQLEELLALGVLHFSEKPFKTQALTDTLWDLAHGDVPHRRIA